MSSIGVPLHNSMPTPSMAFFCANALWVWVVCVCVCVSLCVCVCVCE